MSVTIVEHGDIFALRPQPHAVVVPVNCVGAPGKGFALAAAKAWPKWARAYKAKCRDGNLLPGDIHIYNRARDERHWDGLGPSLIIAAAVKDHWRDPSLLAWVEMTLHKLAEFGLLYRHGAGVPPLWAMPSIGCGLGGLSWDDVRPMAEKILARALCVNWQVYAPHEAAKKGSKR